MKIVYNYNYFNQRKILEKKYDNKRREIKIFIFGDN